MVMQIETSTSIPIEQVREELVRSVFVEFGKDAVHGAVETEFSWEPVPISTSKKKLGDEVVRLVDKNRGPTEITLEKRAWDLSAPGVIIFKGLQRIYQGTIENAIPRARDLSY